MHENSFEVLDDNDSDNVSVSNSSPTLTSDSDDDDDILDLNTLDTKPNGGSDDKRSKSASPLSSVSGTSTPERKTQVQQTMQNAVFVPINGVGDTPTPTRDEEKSPSPSSLSESVSMLDSESEAEQAHTLLSDEEVKKLLEDSILSIYKSTLILDNFKVLKDQIPHDHDWSHFIEVQQEFSKYLNKNVRNIENMTFKNEYQDDKELLDSIQAALADNQREMLDILRIAEPDKDIQTEVSNLVANEVEELRNTLKNKQVSVSLKIHEVIFKLHLGELYGVREFFHSKADTNTLEQWDELTPMLRQKGLELVEVDDDTQSIIESMREKRDEFNKIVRSITSESRSTNTDIRSYLDSPRSSTKVVFDAGSDGGFSDTDDENGHNIPGNDDALTEVDTDDEEEETPTPVRGVHSRDSSGSSGGSGSSADSFHTANGGGDGSAESLVSGFTDGGDEYKQELNPDNITGGVGAMSIVHAAHVLGKNQDLVTPGDTETKREMQNSKSAANMVNDYSTVSLESAASGSSGDSVATKVRSPAAPESPSAKAAVAAEPRATDDFEIKLKKDKTKVEKVRAQDDLDYYMANKAQEKLDKEQKQPRAPLV